MKKLIWISAIVVLGISCSKSLTNSDQSSTPTANLDEPHPSPSPTIHVEKTVVVNQLFEERCSNQTLDFSESNIQIRGLVFTYSHSYEYWYTEGSFDDSIFLSSQDVFYRFSPDDNRIVYKKENGGSYSYVVMEANGSNRKEFTWQENWPDPQKSRIWWLTEDELVIKRPEKTYVISPHSGETFAEITYPDVVYTEIYSQVNSILSHMIYYQEGQLYLIDLTLNEPYSLGNYVYDPSMFNLPDFSRDSSFVVKIWGEETNRKVHDIYIFDLRGVGTQSSNFSSIFNEFFIGPYSISRDGQYIAFLGFFPSKLGPQHKLFVYDIYNDTLIDYCLTYEDTTNFLYSLKWLPDNQHVSTFLTSDQEVVVNIHTGEKYYLPEGILSYAWPSK